MSELKLYSSQTETDTRIAIKATAKVDDLIIDATRYVDKASNDFDAAVINTQIEIAKADAVNEAKSRMLTLLASEHDDPRKTLTSEDLQMTATLVGMTATLVGMSAMRVTVDAAIAEMASTDFDGPLKVLAVKVATLQGKLSDIVAALGE